MLDADKSVSYKGKDLSYDSTLLDNISDTPNHSG